MATALLVVDVTHW